VILAKLQPTGFSSGDCLTKDKIPVYT